MKRISILLAGAALAASCAHAPPKVLTDARAEYDSAKSGPAAELAPVPLYEARKALERADDAYAEDARSQDTKDLAYIALRKAQIAESQARAEQARRDKSTAEATLRTHEQQQLAEAQKQLAAKEQETREREQALQQAQQQLAQQQQAQQQDQAAIQQMQDNVREREQQLAQAQQDAAQLKAQADAAEQRAKEAEQKLTEQEEQLKKIAQVREEQRGLVLTLSGSLLFASGSADLLPAAQRKLDEVAEALKQNKDQTFLVEGHTDSQGSPQLNDELSYRRAASVRDYLASRGIDAHRIKAEGYGSARPVADNRTPEGRANNRRVEIVIQRGVGGGGQEMNSE